MSIAEREGVYLLCSCDAFGTRIYKVGRSENLRKRLGSYSPNWCLLDCLPCTNSVDVERTLIKAFRESFKLYDRNEYFVIEGEMLEVKLFFNTVLCAGGGKKELPKKEKEKDGERELPKKEKEKSKTVTLSKLREETLEHYNFLTKKDILENAKEYNTLITSIISNKTKPREELAKILKPLLANIVAKKKSKEYVDKIIVEGVTDVTEKLKIPKEEIEKIFK